MRALPVIVIGGGQAGLAASHHLRRHGIEHLVLEQGRVGETWRSQRWDSFVLNTPRWMSLLPGEADEAIDRDAFLSTAAWVDQLEAAVRRDQVPIQEGARVTRVEARADGVLVRAEGSEGVTDYEAQAVIVASGAMNIPRVPPIAASFPAGIGQLTSGSYRRPADLPDGAVLVVGSAQSGVQITEDLARAGRTVYLATSRVARVRRRYRGRDMFEWMRMAGWWDQRADQLPDREMVHWANPQTSGVGAGGHTVSLQSLEAVGVRLLGRPTSVDGAVVRLDDTLGAAILFGDQISAQLVRLADQVIEASNLAAPLPEPDPADAPHPNPAAAHSPASLDLDRAGVATVVWTTGFRGDFSFLPPAAVDTDGSPIQVGGQSALPGISFLGLPWLTKRKSPIIHGLDEDASMVVDRVATRLSSA